MRKKQKLPSNVIRFPSPDFSAHAYDTPEHPVAWVHMALYAHKKGHPGVLVESYLNIALKILKGER